MLINNRTKPLLPILQANIAWADKITICVAFFRNSGLQEILKGLKKKEKGNVQIIVGVGFYQTEPIALMAAFKNDFKLFLQKEDSSKTFHPKVYLFQKGRKYRAIIGSSNMTKGGLVDNVEMSFAFDSAKDGATINELKKELEFIKASEDFEKVRSKLSIENYKVKFDKYKKIVMPTIKGAKKEVKKIHRFEVDSFIDYVEDNRDIISDVFEDKNKRYQFAKSQLKKIAKSKYSSASSFLDDYQLVIDSFHSSGLNRGKTIFSKKYKTIIQLIHQVQTIKPSTKKTDFEKAKELLNEIPKLGINALTEILNTFHPKVFPVLNGRTMSVFENLGLKIYKAPNSFSVGDYFQYVEIMTEVKKQCGFKDFRETDLAISYYYSDEVQK